MPGGVVRGPVAPQPVRGLVQTGKLAHLVGVQKRQPAVDLPLVESVRAAEAVQPLAAPVHPAQLGGAFDELERQAAAGSQVGVERRLPATVHRAPAVDGLHHVERHAQHRRRSRRRRSARHAAHRCRTAPAPAGSRAAGRRCGPSSARAPGIRSTMLLAAPRDQVQRVLRPAGQLFEHRFFAVARSIIRVEPTTKDPCIHRHRTPHSLCRE